MCAKLVNILSMRNNTNANSYLSIIMHKLQPTKIFIPDCFTWFSPKIQVMNVFTRNLSQFKVPNTFIYTIFSMHKLHTVVMT